MKIAILAAMDKELQLIREQLSGLEETSIDGMSIYHGNIANHDVYLTKCGIGKVNSALNTYRIIDRVHPDLVINSGVAGGAGLPIGSVLVADSVAYHDVWCGPGTEYGEADGCPLLFEPDRQVASLAFTGDTPGLTTGLICSGDKFISAAEEIREIRSHFPQVRAVDMESASIAQTCWLTSTPFSIIRVVSDTPGEDENLEQYKTFWKDAPLKTFSVVKRIIESM